MGDEIAISRLASVLASGPKLLQPFSFAQYNFHTSAPDQARPVPEHMSPFLEAVRYDTAIRVAIPSPPLSDPREWRPVLSVAAEGKSFSAILGPVTLRRGAHPPHVLICPTENVLELKTGTQDCVFLHPPNKPVVILGFQHLVEKSQSSRHSALPQGFARDLTSSC